MDDFTDIRIVSLEDELTVDSPARPELRYVFFKLSQTPIPIWATAFEASRRISRHPHWRRAWLDRKFIIVECLPDEIEKYHLADLKQDIAAANQACRKYFASKPRPDLAKAETQHQDREKLREIKGRLNFN